MSHGVDAGGSNRAVPLAAAIIAVLAALGTLLAHHRSIGALSAKNQAILTQTRASDAFNAYEAKEVRYNVYQALLASGLVRSAPNRTRVEAAAQHERASSAIVLAKAKALEEQAVRDEERSEAILKSYETVQFATTLFEISIVFVSISALTRARRLLPAGCGLSVVGIALLAFGLLRGA